MKKIITLFDSENQRKEDFYSLKPGTKEWKEYWKTYPEDQEKMLAFKKQLNKPVLRKVR